MWVCKEEGVKLWGHYIKCFKVAEGIYNVQITNEEGVYLSCGVYLTSIIKLQPRYIICGLPKKKV